MAEYAFNPLSGKLDRIGDGGGGGGNISITGDNGPTLTSNTFDIVGQDSGTAEVITVDTTTGDVVIANNAWETAYIVDASTVEGDKGTFLDLQSAIDAIVADGVATSTNCGIIHMRPGEYTYDDEILIPADVCIAIKGSLPTPVADLSFQYDVSLNANIVMTSTSTLYLYNLLCFTSSGVCITTNSANFFGSNCYFTSVDFSGIVNLQECVVIEGTISDVFRASQCNGITATVQSGSAHFKMCGIITIEHEDGQIIIRQCSECVLTGTPGPTASVYIYDTPMDQTITNTATSLFIGNITADASGNIESQGSFFGAGTNPQLLSRIKANCYITKVISDDYIASQYDHLISVQSNTGPVEINFDATGLNKGIKGQTWIVADMEGTASTNPITITSVNGLINGAASFVISENYGTVEVYFDGTNFFTLNSSSSGGNGSNIIITKYETPGNFTWTKNPNTSHVQVWGWGGGSGGGGGGTSDPSVLGSGGGGGGSGTGAFYFEIPAQVLAATENVTVGAGGLGGAGGTGIDGYGENGAFGGYTSFALISTWNESIYSTASNFSIGYGGGSGIQGSGGSSGPVIINTSVFFPDASAGTGAFDSPATNGDNYPTIKTGYESGSVYPSIMGNFGGGGGGAVPAPDTVQPAGNGGSINFPADNSIIIAGGLAGADGGGNGIYGTNGGAFSFSGLIYSGTGGGGGGANSAGNGGRGGDGGKYGGGGGGGGSSINGFSAGNGGNGGDGALWVIEYL